MAKRIMETYQSRSCHPSQETNNYGNGRVPRSTLTWKKNIWKFNCSTSRPFQKGSVYKVLPIFEVCIFISKTELWKNTAPARRSCLLAHVEPFFHFQNSVGDCKTYFGLGGSLGVIEADLGFFYGWLN